MKMRGLVHDCFAKHLYDSAIFFADKLVTMSEGADTDVFTLAEVLSRSSVACLHLPDASQPVLGVVGAGRMRSCLGHAGLLHGAAVPQSAGAAAQQPACAQPRQGQVCMHLPLPRQYATQTPALQPMLTFGGHAWPSALHVMRLICSPQLLCISHVHRGLLSPACCVLHAGWWKLA